MRLYGYVPDPLIYFDPLGLEKTFCLKARRWRNEAGRFVKRPADPAELVKVATALVNGSPVRKGSIDFHSLWHWNQTATDWNPNKPGNQWHPDPSKFPTGGFSFDKRAPNGNRYSSHGHGPDSNNPNLAPGCNAKTGPVTSIRRVQNGRGEDLTEFGTWENPSLVNANAKHIPLKNSPY